MRKTATTTDIYSFVNSLVPNYLVALPSSLLPTDTRVGNTAHYCGAALRSCLKDEPASTPIVPGCPCGCGGENVRIQLSLCDL